MKKPAAQYRCPMEATLDLIGGKWKALILWHLVKKSLRFNELQKLMPQATPKMLTQQLRDLERDLLISRTIYPVVPPKVKYALTAFGRSLIPILETMCAWGSRYLESAALPDPCCGRSG